MAARSILIALALLGWMSRTSIGEPSYTFEQFQISDSFLTFSQGINDSGQVVGFRAPLGMSSESGFLRNPDGTSITFAAPGMASTLPRGINNLGVIAGEALSDEGEMFGFLRDPSGSFTLFDVPGFVSDINDSGVVLGERFLRTPDGTITPLTSPIDGVSIWNARAINNLGDIVGLYRTSSGGRGNFLWEADNTFTLLSVPGSVRGINDLGDIASVDGTFGPAYLSLATGETVTLDALQVNERGDPIIHMVVNNRRQVAGYTGPGTESFLGTPDSLGAVIPEPSSLALALCGSVGLMGMALVARRGRRSSGD